MTQKIADWVRGHQTRGAAFIHRLKVDKAQSRIVGSTVRLWWSNRLVAQCQLTNLISYRPGYDYYGDGSWKKSIAVATLHSDYLICCGFYVSRSQFMAHLLPVLGRVRTKIKKVRIEDCKGRLFLRPRRRFVLFNDYRSHVRAFQQAVVLDKDTMAVL